MMTSEEYLTRVYTAKEIEDTIWREIKEVQDNLYSLSAIDYEKPRVSGGNGRNATEDKIIELLDKRDKMITDYLTAINRRWEFKQLVEQMSDERMKVVRKRHYLWHETWERLATVFAQTAGCGVRMTACGPERSKNSTKSSKKAKLLQASSW